ncbi:hypothetical protein F5Y17DRAFT_77781 [Xylariaceae sp. FL0594]|nr:hypothetical protein F5Y17DRAFT_77781 [Xylariaceae sp. FL0594]
MTLPTFLSPALPSELLSYILDCHVYPTTLIICSSRGDFFNSLVEDIASQTATATDTPHQSEQHEPQDGYDPSFPSQGEDRQLRPDLKLEGETSNKMRSRALLSSPLYQVAISRHIRVVYASTVTHLRACLSVFAPETSKVPPPPAAGLATSTAYLGPRHGEKPKPHIILYGLVSIHRDTSEWSAQGLSNTVSAFVDLTHRLSWGGLVFEPRRHSPSAPSPSLEEVLREPVPILSGGARRLGPHAEDGSAWTGRTVEIGRVLGRWFRFERAHWDTQAVE